MVKKDRLILEKMPTLERSGSERQEERLHPSPFCKGRGLGSGLRIPSSQEGNRGVENAFLNGKEGRVGFRKNYDTIYQ